MAEEKNRFIQISTTIGAIAVNGVRVPKKDTAEEEVYMSETGQLIRVKKAQIVFVTEDQEPRRDPAAAPVPKDKHPSGERPELVIVDDLPESYSVEHRTSNARAQRTPASKPNEKNSSSKPTLSSRIRAFMSAARMSRVTAIAAWARSVSSPP